MDQITRQLERNMLLDAPPPELNPAAPSRLFRRRRYLAYAGMAAMVMIISAIVTHTLIDGKLYDQYSPSADRQPDTGEQQLATTNGTTPAEGFSDALAMNESKTTDPFALEEGIVSKKTVSPKRTEPEASLGPILSWRNPKKRSISQEKLGEKDRLAAQEGRLAERQTDLPAAKSSDTSGGSQIETFARLTPTVTSKAEAAQQPQGALAAKVLDYLAKTDKKSSADTDEVRSIRDGQAAPSSGITPVLDVAPENESSVSLAVLAVKVETTDAGIAQQFLLTWAINNETQIKNVVSEKSGGLRQQSDSYRGGRDYVPTDQADSRSSKPTRLVTLNMLANRLPDLLNDLNNFSDLSAHVVPQISSWDQTYHAQTVDTFGDIVGEDHSGKTPAKSLSPLANLDWNRLILPRLPLQLTVPVHPPQSEIAVRVRIYEGEKADEKN